MFVFFRVKKSDHLARRKMINDLQEHGGNFSLDPVKKLIHGADLDVGKYSSIIMTRGLVEWHSHPKLCQKRSCTIGVPSPQDISNILYGHLYGCMGHFVYSEEGTYFVQFPNKVVEYLRCDIPRLEKYVADLTAQSDKLHQYFLDERFEYKDYSKYWLKLMGLCGVTVKLFKKDTVPRVKLWIPAELVKNHPKTLYTKIRIPSNIKADKNLCRH